MLKDCRMTHRVSKDHWGYRWWWKNLWDAWQSFPGHSVLARKSFLCVKDLKCPDRCSEVSFCQLQGQKQSHPGYIQMWHQQSRLGHWKAGLELCALQYPETCAWLQVATHCLWKISGQLATTCYRARVSCCVLFSPETQSPASVTVSWSYWVQPSQGHARTHWLLLPCAKVQQYHNYYCILIVLQDICEKLI